MNEWPSSLETSVYPLLPRVCLHHNNSAQDMSVVSCEIAHKASGFKMERSLLIRTLNTQSCIQGGHYGLPLHHRQVSSKQRPTVPFHWVYMQNTLSI